MEAMAKMEDNAFELSIIDPPYGIDRDEWDQRPNQGYWNELFRVSENQIVFGGNYYSLPIRESWLCWDKTNNGKSFFKHKSKFELIWCSFDVKPDFIRYTLDGNVQGFTAKPDYNKTKAIHSTQKPVDVYKFLLKNYASEFNYILDTHLGSGSIAIACHDMGFDLEAYEIDQEYHQAALQRLNTHRSQLQMF